MLFTLLIFFLTITVLVAFHEAGHYSIARCCGVKVERFSIGFGKPLLRWRSRRSGTEFVISAIPLGGYVKMFGEDESQIATTPQPHAFNQKSLWQRTAIVLAGPCANFLLAWLVYWMIHIVGIVQIAPIIGHVLPNTAAAQAGLLPEQEIIALDDQGTPSWLAVRFALLSQQGSKATNIQVRDSEGVIQRRQLVLSNWQIDPNFPQPLRALGIIPWIPNIPLQIERVLPNSAAANAGLQSGDQLKKINQHPIKSWDDLQGMLQQQPQRVQLTITRAGQQQTVTIYPTRIKNPDGTQRVYLGIESPRIEWPAKFQRKIQEPWYTAWYPAGQKTLAMTQLTVKMLGKMLLGHVSWRSVSGPIGIAQGAGQTARISWIFYLQFFALLSISLGVLNLLPIPLLDGGMLVFYVWEALRGKPAPVTVRHWGMRIGIFLVLGLMLMAFYNDLTRLWQAF